MPGTNQPRIPKTLRSYRLGREIGRGGMGVVFEGRDRRDGSRVAIKVLHPHLSAADRGYRDRFEREAHVAALLRSPYTVHLLDFGVVDDCYFLVMEFVEGQSLADVIEKGPIAPADALRIASSVARALEEAEARGVVHRDIKPENVLLDASGAAKVTDFGIARQQSDSTLTMRGAFVGTAAYAAPEQTEGIADKRSDIYSLGATLFTMLTARPPFGGATVIEILRAHREAPVPMAPLAGLPDPLINVIRRCMEKDPLDRYQSASELAGALQRATHALRGGSTWAPLPYSGPAPAVSVPSGSPAGSIPSQPSTGPGPEAVEPTRVTPAEPTQVVQPPPVPAVPSVAPVAVDAASLAGAPPPATSISAPETPAAAAVALPDQTRVAATPPLAAGVSAGADAPVPWQTTGVGMVTTGTTSGNLQLALRRRPGTSTIRGTTTYELLIHNEGATWAEPRLMASDPTGSVVIRTPEHTTVPPGGTGVVEVSVAPRRRRLRGGRETHSFLVAAGGDGGGLPPATVSGEFEDVPMGRVVAAGGLLGIGLAAALAVGVVFAAGGGDDNKASSAPEASPSPSAQVSAAASTVALASPSPSLSASPAASAEASPTDAATPTASPAADTPTPTAAPVVQPTPVPPPPPTPVPPPPPTPIPPTATPVPPTPTPVPSGIEGGEWTYYFTVASNNCGFGAAVGQGFGISYFIGDAGTFIVAGQAVDVYQRLDQDYWLGTYTFSYPQFNVGYRIYATATTPEGRGLLQNTFTSSTRGSARLTETYGSCTIVMVDNS